MSWKYRGKMSHQTSPTPISSETVARIEPHLDQSELCSCIFLLYDNVETALQHILFESQQSPRKYLPVLDSALFKPGECFHEGPIAQWARFSNGKDGNWQNKLLEALLIIKNFWIIRSLGRSKRDLDLKFLPSQPNTSLHIDLVRKVLFLMIEDLTLEEWNKLQTALIKEAKQHVENEYRRVPECLLLMLMSRNILAVRKVDQRMDFTILRSCLKSLDLYYWAQQLKDIEDVVNRGAGDEADSAIDDLQIAISRFDLDPKSPGTILIFNLESYNEKSVGMRPLTTRTGSHVDCERLRATFKLLGFNVIIHKDSTSKVIRSEISKSLKTFCEEAKQIKRERCFVVAILAHGDKDGVIAMDGTLVEWDSIRAELRSSETAGLPRLLLIQACKGVSQVTKTQEKLEVAADGPTSYAEAHSGNLRDLFELSSSVSGFAAYRSPVHGSFFIHSFCKHVLLYGRHVPMHQLAPLINRDFDKVNLVHKGRTVFMTSELTVTASKLLYLSIPDCKEADAKALVRSWDSMDEKNALQQLQEKQNLGNHQSLYENTQEKEKEKGQRVQEEKETDQQVMEDKEKAKEEEHRKPCNKKCPQNQPESSREEDFFQELKKLALTLGKL